MRLFFSILLLLPIPALAQLELKTPRPPKPTNFPEIVVSRERASDLMKSGMVPIHAERLKVDGACVTEGLTCVRDGGTADGG